MIKKLWWKLKVLLFPHLDRRAAPRPATKMNKADDMLVTAIIDLGKAIERNKK